MKMVSVSLLILIFLWAAVPVSGSGEQQRWSPPEDVFKTPGGTVAELYKAVTFAPGAAPDWELVKNSFFIPEAVIVLRTARDKMSVIDRDGFVRLFISDVKKYQLDKSGFKEELISSQLKVFGSIAQCLTVYEVSIPGRDRKQRGVDSFLLMKKEARWWIVSVVNDVPTPGNPIPQEWLGAK
jgi:hypothetical protein